MALFITSFDKLSEDIDLVQVNAEPIKETIDHLREALSWLGEPVVKQKKHNNTLVFRVPSTDVGAGEIHLKVEINCKEHVSVFPMVRVPFSVENDWFSGQCEVLTYELNELVGTKVRALYQRLKGRDLFDVFTAFITGKLDLDRVMTAYDHYLRFVANHAPKFALLSVTEGKGPRSGANPSLTAQKTPYSNLQGVFCLTMCKNDKSDVF